MKILNEFKTKHHHTEWYKEIQRAGDYLFATDGVIPIEELVNFN